MDNINFNSELFNLADDMNVSIIVVGEDCSVTGSNRQGEKILDSLNVDRTKPCLALFSNFNDPCLDCPLSNWDILGKKGVVKEQTLGTGAVKKVVYRRKEDGKGFYMALMDLYEDSQSETLLKQSERLKRVLLDNLNSSFLIINTEGEVERAHFVEEVSVLMGKRGYLSSLSQIFNHDISQSIMAKIQNMTTKDSRVMCHFRFEFKGQILWLDFYICPIEGDKFFLSILDKTSEHYLLERLEKLNDVELNCLKVNDISSKVSNLISGLTGYTNMALKKSDNPAVIDILNSMKQVAHDSIAMLNMINHFTMKQPSSVNDESGLIPSADQSVSLETFHYLSIDKALELLENNVELYNTVVDDFIHDYGDVNERLELLFHNDYEGAQILVHSIKGVAGILGAYTLQDQANLLEGYIRHEEWGEAEKLRLEFSNTLSGVIKELKQINQGEGRIRDDDKWSLHGMSLNNHQADLLKEIIPLAEAGDYNGLRDNLKPFSSFDWGHDWTEITRILTEQIDNIDFDGVLKSIHTLID